MNNRISNLNQDNVPNMIPSPYNFVPLSDKVVFPEWSEQISHDVPFSDGLSGTLEITITADSDLFIGGEKLKDKSDRDIRYFFKANGKYYIPGTSLKGMIRNVLEIASFGKMSRVADDRYSYRDLRNPTYRDAMTKASSKGYESKVKAGWLIQGEDGVCIIPSLYARVEAGDLSKVAKRPVRLGKKQSSLKKYEQWGSDLGIKFNIADSDTHPHSDNKKLVYTKAIKLGSGTSNGTIVFTGQPTEYGKVRNSKHLEFIFYNEQENNKIKISDQLFKEFKFIHSTDGIAPNDEWKYWSRKLKNNERVPVFYLTDPNNDIHSFGLAMMYRLPYKYGVHDLVRNTNEEHLNPTDNVKREFQADLADSILGYTNKVSSLKGRVHFGHLEGPEVVENDTQAKMAILGTPKPTYYPNYIEQEKASKINRYKTFNDDAKIRGWKRYPVEIEEKDEKNLLEYDEQKFKNVLTYFKPLKAESTFKGKIRYHNLRPVELGALLWSLTFGGNSRCKHKIGFAKPLGYGIISVDVSSNNLDQRTYRDQFEEYMNEKLPLKFRDNEQIKELMAMADETQTSKYEYRYPRLDDKEFVGLQGEKIALEKYTESMTKVQNQKTQTNQPAPVKKTIEVGLVEKAVEGIVSAKNSSNNKEFNKYIKIIIEEGSLTEEQYATIERVLRPKKSGLIVGDIFKDRVKLLESIKPLVKKKEG